MNTKKETRTANAGQDTTEEPILAYDQIFDAVLHYFNNLNDAVKPCSPSLGHDRRRCAVST